MLLTATVAFLLFNRRLLRKEVTKTWYPFLVPAMPETCADPVVWPETLRPLVETHGAAVVWLAGFVLFDFPPVMASGDELAWSRVDWTRFSGSKMKGD